MRLLQKNQQTFYYAIYLNRDEDVRDDDGNLTGDKKPVYDSPKKATGNISTSIGELDEKIFGGITDYSRTVCTTAELPEKTRVWIGIVPDTQETPHNYEVKRKGDSLNETIYALQEVTVQ